MNFIGRILLLPMLVVMVIAAVFLPLMPVILWLEPTVENAFTLLVLVGFWPGSVAFVHGAYIEHFIVRSVSARSESVIHLTSDPDYLSLVLWAGDHLMSAMEDAPDPLGPETVARGRALARRHRTIASWVWYGLAISAVGALGLYLIQR